MASSRRLNVLLFVCLSLQLAGAILGVRGQKSSSYSTDRKKVDTAKMSKVLASSTPATIRIKWIFDSKQRWLTPQQKNALLDTYIPETTAVLQQYIKVRVPTTAPIKFSSETICKFNDAALSGPGVAGVDLVMYVSEGDPKDPKLCTATKFASAGGCDWDPITLRPTIGHMTICPNLFSQTKGEVGATITHEVLHAMGFGSGWFVWYYNQDGGKPYDLVAETRQQGGKNVPYLTTPRVAAYARSFFNCPSLPGAPLDSSLSHWATDLIPRDLMVGGPIESGQGSKMTMFTLLALEDSGWYVTNKEAAEELEVGRGQGCTFAQGQCEKYLAEDRANNNYCPTSWQDASACTPDYRGIGYCKTGASGCFIPSYANKATEVLQCTNPDTFTTTADKTFRTTVEALGGVLSPNSRCVVADVPSGGKAARPCSKDGKTCVPSTRAALCVETKCNTQGQVVLAFKGQKEVVCQKRGAVINLVEQLPGLFSSGSVYCPLPEAVCPTLSCGPGGCGPNADCWQGSCKCHMGFTGSPCRRLSKAAEITAQSG